MERNSELLRGNTPTMILAVLRDNPMHGYAVAHEIARRSGHALKFGQGTLYPALHALEQDGWVRGEWIVGAGKRPRKIYSITPSGLKELEKRLRAWRGFVTAMEGVVGLFPGEQPA